MDSASTRAAVWRNRTTAATRHGGQSKCRALPCAPAPGHRPLQRFIDHVHVLGNEARLQRRHNRRITSAIFGRIFGRLLNRDLIEAELVLAGADKIAEGDRHGRANARTGVHAVRVASGIEHVGHQLRVVGLRTVMPCCASIRALNLMLNPTSKRRPLPAAASAPPAHRRP